MEYHSNRKFMVCMLVSALSGCRSLESLPVVYGSNPDKDSADSKAAHPYKEQEKVKKLNLNLHVFGLSYHPDREGTRISHLDNEVNAGMGLN